MAHFHLTADSSSRHRIAAAAVVLLAAVAVVVAVYWREILEAVIWLCLAIVSWRWFRHRHLAPKRCRGLLGDLAVAALGYLLGRRHAAGTHPCSQCGHPIGAPSRAAYCSPVCRRYAALERQEVERKATALEAFGDVPDGFGELPEGY